MNKEELLQAGLNLFKVFSPYLKEEEVELPSFSKEEFQNMAKLAKEHSLTAFLYCALDKYHYFAKLDNPKIEEYFRNHFLKNLRKTYLFEEERNKLYQFFEENKINYLPVKGVILNSMYPTLGSREFADNDILIDETRMKDTKKYFLSQGYDAGPSSLGSPHDEYYKEPSLNFEIHRFLFSESDERSKSYYSYFRDTLTRNKRINHHSYMHLMSDEEFYVYFIAHANKHESFGGIGLRTLIDIYIYLKNKPNLNKEEVETLEKELEIYDLDCRLQAINNALIEHKGELDKEYFLFLVSSGTYGTTDHAVKQGIDREMKKGKDSKEAAKSYLMKRVFPPMSYYKTSHPLAYKTKVLIPFVWIGRLFAILFTPERRKRAQNEYKTVKNHSENRSNKD